MTSKEGRAPFFRLPWKWAHLFFVLFWFTNLLIDWDYWGKHVKEDPLKFLLFLAGSYLLTLGFVFLVRLPWQQWFSRKTS